MDGSLQAGPNHLSAERDAFIAPHLQKDLERFGTSWGEVCGGSDTISLSVLDPL